MTKLVGFFAATLLCSKRVRVWMRRKDFYAGVPRKKTLFYVDDEV